MTKNSLPQLGIIEGFFGRSWPWDARAEYATFLAANNYHYYIYAPKNDAFLRKRWQEDWPAEVFGQLQHLRQVYQQHQIGFGLGLSPYELYLEPHPHRTHKLARKIQYLNELQPDILCLLFDDMRGDLPHLAEIQCELVACAAEYSTAQHIIFCPTFYSFDPVLEKVFGARPAHYWEHLGKHLDQRIDIFWTGPKVCSTHYPSEHLQQVSGLLQRKPFLWDNYPVNDGAIKSNLLQLRAFNEQHGQLKNQVAGHAVNPMNQPWLSRIPLFSLPLAYNGSVDYDPSHAFIHACQHLCEPEVASELIKDIGLLQDVGLSKFSNAQHQGLMNKYQTFSNSPYAREIIDWLQGGYQFDPACLTE